MVSPHYEFYNDIWNHSGSKKELEKLNFKGYLIKESP